MIFDYLPQLARIDGIKYCCSAFFLVTAIQFPAIGIQSARYCSKDHISYIGDPDVISRRKKEDSKRKEEGANSFTDFSEEILTNPSANLKVKCLFFVCLCIFFFTQHFSV